MTPKDREFIADALAACIKQILHLEGLRAEDKGPIPSTLSPSVVKDADAAIKRIQRPLVPMDGQGDWAEQRDYYSERGKGLG